MTTSLLMEAPIQLTQTVNRVVERTIETVTPAPTPTNPNPPSKQIETVVINEDDSIISAIAKNTPSIVRIREQNADSTVDNICKSITDEIVVAANYNCPGQLVISGSPRGIELASEKLKEAGAKRVLPLKVGGAFHSPFMAPAKEELAQAIMETNFSNPICPIYQNYTSHASQNADVIKQNLIDQLTGSVQWTRCVFNMIQDGALTFYEVGPGSALTGMIKKINAEVLAEKKA
jgi:malonyl CoA-acyl carrier protein transacylase